MFLTSTWNVDRRCCRGDVLEPERVKLCFHAASALARTSCSATTSIGCSPSARLMASAGELSCSNNRASSSLRPALHLAVKHVLEIRL